MGLNRRRSRKVHSREKDSSNFVVGKQGGQSLFEDEKTDEGAGKLNIKFDELKKLKTLGQGSQGSVDKMLHVPTNTIVALKVPD